jgi:nitrogen fixation NifU-like protein
MGAYEMYQAQVLDHYRNPRNKGTLPDPDIEHKESNPLCGDEIEFQLALDAKGKVKDVRFDGHGCAISLSSASMLSERIKGMPLKKILRLTKDDVLGMLGVPLTPARLKCALIPLDALVQGIIEYGKAHAP